MRQALGFKQLGSSRAKAEIFLGLSALALGQILVIRSPDIWMLVCGATLIVLGGYLAMAGHRSHLYQAHNKISAYVVEEGLVRARCTKGGDK
ncbi:MAG: hypothetical protein KTR25_09135 [Myxococcales bacterium]|nr:hypothetical protein [Myxococcales bacterium]